ncbi:MAG: hypothetical protein M1834_006202 [Cirrosporium novae-zelandiae]|nr:MAG: hypothetical protein M1834_006202 [Cirrosporium novae-zelandiae]
MASSNSKPRKTRDHTKASPHVTMSGITLYTNEPGKLVEAVFLHQMKLSPAESLNNYDHKPKQGKRTADLTSYIPLHRTWGPGRAERPEILFELNNINPPCTDPVTFLKDSNGRVVLDTLGWVVRDIPHIPRTISTKVEGWRIEAISRADSWICMQDFRARMPLSLTPTGGDSRPSTGTVAMRANHKLFKELTPQMVEGNTTRGLRDLTRTEVGALYKEGYGTGFHKAGKRKLTDTQRQQNKEQYAADLHGEKTDTEGQKTNNLQQEPQKIMSEMEKNPETSLQKFITETLAEIKAIKADHQKFLAQQPWNQADTPRGATVQGVSNRNSDPTSSRGSEPGRYMN